MSRPATLHVRKEVIVKEDGRKVILYSFVPAEGVRGQEPTIQENQST